VRILLRCAGGYPARVKATSGAQCRPDDKV
jgi:hypothetical protein